MKSAIDVACWDILGKATGLPVSELLGGRVGPDFVLYRAISQESPEVMASRVAAYRSEGYRRFQLKVGADVETDIERIRAVAAELERSGERWLIARCRTAEGESLTRLNRGGAIDYVHDHHHRWTLHDFPKGKKPSDVFREHIITCFIDDVAGAIVYALEAPPHVGVSEILMRPTAQLTNDLALALAAAIPAAVPDSG